MAGAGRLTIFKEPVCLVSTTADNKLEVSQQVIEELNELDKPVVVVAIVGLYRTGKSYLMNRLAGRNSGFALGATVQSKTKGIWIWVVDHPVYPHYHLLLMDTEGLGDVDKGDPDHDIWIFCLATLLSSVLVYNVFSVIRDDVIEKLNFITEMSKHIRTKSSDTADDDDDDYDYYFPMFVFALRDFTLDLEIDGVEVTSDEYMEHCLELKPGDDSRIRRRNKPRECIRKYFKTRNCFTFDRPTGRTRLKCLDSVEDSDLSADFLEESNSFCSFIYSSGKVKRLENGTKLNGRMWAFLVTRYVDAISGGCIPCIENAVESMIKIENERLVDEAVNHYIWNMNLKLTLPTPDDETLRRVHGECLELALNHFVKGSVFDQDHSFQTQLFEHIKEPQEHYVLENEAVSRKNCSQLLLELNRPIDDKLRAGIYRRSGGFQEYQQDCNNLRREYRRASGLGVKKDQMLVDFMSKKTSEGDCIMAADRRMTEEIRAAEAERQKCLAMKRQKEVAEKERERHRQLARETEKAKEEAMKQMRRKHDENMRRERQHRDKILDNRLRENERQMREKSKRELRQLREEINRLR